MNSDSREVWARLLPERESDKAHSVIAKHPLSGTAHAIAGADDTSCGALSPNWEHRFVDLDVARQMHTPCRRCDWKGYAEGAADGS